MDTLIIDSGTSSSNHEFSYPAESADILSQWLGALESKSSLYWYQYSESEDRVLDMSPCRSIAHRDSELIAAITENCTHHGPVCYFCRYLIASQSCCFTQNGHYYHLKSISVSARFYYK